MVHYMILKVFSEKELVWVRWYTPAIPTTWRLRREGPKFEASLHSMVVNRQSKIAKRRCSRHTQHRMAKEQKTDNAACEQDSVHWRWGCELEQILCRTVWQPQVRLAAALPDCPAVVLWPISRKRNETIPTQTGTQTLQHHF